jgi:hypothetical protein
VALLLISVVLERDSSQTPVTILLDEPVCQAEGLFVAGVRFDGAELESVTATGPDGLAAALEALRRGTAALDSFRASGGRVSVYVQGCGLEPFECTLERLAQVTLDMNYGPPETHVHAVIVEGPTPDASGDVLFKVQVGDRFTEVVACPDGLGFLGEDLELGNKGTGAVASFLREHRDQEVEWYREAARLRRAAGKPPHIAPAPSTRVTVAESVHYDRFVMFRTRGAPADICVFVFENGGLMDDCDDYGAVTDDDRLEAMSVVLHYIFTYPDDARALGIDVALLAEFYQ